jgi:hypothetical protein
MLFGRVHENTVLVLIPLLIRIDFQLSCQLRLIELCFNLYAL